MPLAPLIPSLRHLNQPLAASSLDAAIHETAVAIHGGNHAALDNAWRRMGEGPRDLAAWYWLTEQATQRSHALSATIAASQAAEAKADVEQASQAVQREQETARNSLKTAEARLDQARRNAEANPRDWAADEEAGRATMLLAVAKTNAATLTHNAQRNLDRAVQRLAQLQPAPAPAVERPAAKRAAAKRKARTLA